MDEKKSLEFENLFSYGTLQLERVQLASFGRKLDGAVDRIQGYTIDQLEIIDRDVLAKSGEKFHPIAIKSQNQSDYVEGKLFRITADELKEADLYEVGDYKRIRVTFNSGQLGWIYVKA